MISWRILVDISWISASVVEHAEFVDDEQVENFDATSSSLSKDVLLYIDIVPPTLFIEWGAPYVLDWGKMPSFSYQK